MILASSVRTAYGKSRQDFRMASDGRCWIEADTSATTVSAAERRQALIEALATHGRIARDDESQPGSLKLGYTGS